MEAYPAPLHPPPPPREDKDKDQDKGFFSFFSISVLQYYHNNKTQGRGVGNLYYTVLLMDLEAASEDIELRILGP
jgi:hypothetical protein